MQKNHAQNPNEIRTDITHVGCGTCTQYTHGTFPITIQLILQIENICDQMVSITGDERTLH